jgi:transketolase
MNDRGGCAGERDRKTGPVVHRHAALPVVSVEAASPLGWERYVGQRSTIIGMRSFGISAPGKVAQAHFGFDVAHVVAAAREQIARHAQTA